VAANAVLGVAKPHLLDCTEWDVPDQRRRDRAKVTNAQLLPFSTLIWHPVETPFTVAPPSRPQTPRRGLE
jgi:hypothetical protein